MKQILTSTQVTDNLKRLFPENEIKCTEVVNGLDETHFYIETNACKIVIVGKQIWSKPTIREWAKYIMYCNDRGFMYKKMRTLIGTCIPFVYLPAKNSKKAIEQSELLLIACGLKNKKAVCDDIQRLQQFGAKSFIQVYKMIKELEIVDSSLEYERKYKGYGEYINGKLLLSVTHTKGNFKFPIECITGNKEQDEEIKNIFLNLLGKPVTSKMPELIAA